MAIFNSHVKLPEGKVGVQWISRDFTDLEDFLQQEEWSFYNCLVVTGTMEFWMTFHILGISSSHLTNSIIF